MQPMDEKEFRSQKRSSHNCSAVCRNCCSVK